MSRFPSQELQNSRTLLARISNVATAEGRAEANYPVEDVQRILAVTQIWNGPTIVPANRGLEDRLAELLADILDGALLTFAGGAEPSDKPLDLRLHTLRPDLSKRAALLLEEVGR